MAQRFSPNTSVAEQILLNPTFANIDFADFQGLNMNLIDRNAEYSQNIANRRFEEMVQAQNQLLENVKLNQKFDYLEKDLQNKLASVIDNAGNVQLSDNANFNKLNTSLISLKTDPQLKRAVYSSEQARKMQEILQKDPNIQNRPWDAPAINQYKAFLNGETNDFELTPVYKDVDLVPVWDEFFKGLPKNQQENLQKYGPYGLVQAKEEGRDIGDLIEKIEVFKNYTILNNPEITSNLTRRADYYGKQGLNPEETINNYINNSLQASASKFAGISKTISSVQMNPNQSGRMQQEGLNISRQNALTSARQLDATAPIRLVGTTLLKANKEVGQDLQNQFNKQVATLAKNLVIQNETDKKMQANMTSLPINIQKTIITENSDGTYNADVVFQPVKPGAASITKNITIPSSQIQSIANMYNTSVTSSTTKSLSWDPATQTFK